jgi:DNA-binding NarL/FixJ family response regulator
VKRTALRTYRPRGIRRAAANTKEREVYEAHLAGETYAAIARRTGISESTVRHMVGRAAQHEEDLAWLRENTTAKP